MKVFQEQGPGDYQLAGFLPDVFPRVSKSFMYDIRPGDFTWGECDKEGGGRERCIIANKMLGPGDLAACPGFLLADGSPPPNDTQTEAAILAAIVGRTPE